WRGERCPRIDAVEERYLIPLEGRLQLAVLVERRGVALVAIPGVVQRRLQLPAVLDVLILRAIERRTVAQVAVLLEARLVARDAAGASSDFRFARPRFLRVLGRDCGR